LSTHLKHTPIISGGSVTTEELFQAMFKSILEDEPEEAEDLAHEALAQGIDPLEAINRGFMPGVNEIGRQFGCGEVFLPDLVRAGQAMKAATRVLEPEMLRRGMTRQAVGVVVLGTVKGDIHEIGKNLVGTMFIANGFQVHDIGVDVAATAFAAKAQEVNADVVGVSALLTTTMVQQRQVIESLQQVGLRARVKVVVGGAPVTRAWANEIGADGYAEDAVGAVKVAKGLLRLP
jgi:corrinoid protein of di/trimethylamine methyltransferase